MGRGHRRLFPPARPSRQRVAAAAASVRAQMRELAQDRDVFEALAELGDDAVRDTVALVRRIDWGVRCRSWTLWARARAGDVGVMLQDASRFARDMRRPVPVKPIISALGTVFHAWAERELRRGPILSRPWILLRSSGGTSLAGDDGADEVLLTVKERRLLEKAARTRVRRGGWPTIGRWRSKGGASPWRWVACP